MAAEQLELFSARPMEPNAPFSAALRLYQAHLRREGLTENSVKSFVSDIRLLAHYLGIGQPVGDVSTRDLNNFLQWLQHGRGVPCSPKSYARRVTALKSFFKWLTEAKVLESDPSAAVIQYSVSSPLPEILTDAEVRRILAVTERRRRAERPDARPELVVTLVLQTGLKKSEMMAIVPNHIDTSDPQNPFLYVRYSNPRQRHKERKLPLDPQWLEVLDEYIAQYKPRKKLFECTARNLEYVLTDVAEEAGLVKHLSFEMLRWTSAVRDHLAKTAPDKLREKLGLSKISWRENGEKVAKLAASLEAAEVGR
jgi:integrase/recombinase XerD